MTTEILAHSRYNNIPSEELFDDTFAMSYEEVEEALVDWLRKHQMLGINEVVLSSDIPITLESDEVLTEDDLDDDALDFTFDLTIARVTL